MSEAFSPDDHLNRMLVPQNTEIPWYKSLYQAIHEIVKPEKLPPLEVTSKPVAVKDIWGLYARDPKSRYYSIALHVSLFSLLMWGFTSPQVQTAIKRNLGLIDPNLKPYIPEKPKPQTMQGGGGGGAKEPLPVSKGKLPKPAMKQFVPPMIVDHPPKLAMDPSIIAPPDTPLPQSNLNNWGKQLQRQRLRRRHG
jgi:periplasmic protein TonB